jgi:methenyltetrahydromethanopterin cyclohydrolase
VYCTVEHDNEEALRKIVEQAKSYGKPFLQIFGEADRDFYKIDHNLFAPAMLMVNNAKTGRVFKAGQVNSKVLADSLGF